MLNILLTYFPFRWNKTEKSENRNQTKMSDSKTKPKDSNPQVILKVRGLGVSKWYRLKGALCGLANQIQNASLDIILKAHSREYMITLILVPSTTQCRFI